jgi:hypothetical protein
MLAAHSVSYDQPNLGSPDKAMGEQSKYIVVEDQYVVEDFSPYHKNLTEIMAMNHIPQDLPIYSHREYDKYTPLPDPYETARPETPIIIL